jgi:hypothetical protein
LPFAGEADRTHDVGLFLSPFVRHLIHGSISLHGVEARFPGSGKTLLVETLLLPGLGRPSVIPKSSNDE